MRRLPAGVAVTLAAALITPGGGPVVAAPAPGRYVELAALAGGDSFASAMNERGDIAGVSMRADEQRPVLWLGDRARPVELRDHGRWPAAVSNRRDVVFSAIGADPLDRGFRWRHGRLTPLSRPPWQILPVAVDERGRVAGTMYSPPPVTARAFRWEHGRFTVLPAPADLSGEAVGMNDAGQVLGRVYDFATAKSRAVVWKDGRTVDLGSLGGPYTEPAAINDRGHVIGTSALGPYGPVHPFRWANGVLTDLLAGTGTDTGTARAINAAGDIAGSIGGRAVVWHAGRPVFLPTPGAYGIALAINDRGQAVGTTWGGDLGDGPAALFRTGPGARGMTVWAAPAGGTDLEILGVDHRGRVAVSYRPAGRPRVVARTTPLTAVDG